MTTVHKGVSAFSLKRILKGTLNQIIHSFNNKFFGFSRIIEFYSRFGKLPDFSHPKSYTEKIYIRMAFDKNPKWPLFTDKYLVREYVQEKCGSEILPEQYAAIKDPNEIYNLNLPDRFAVKPNHVSGEIKIIKDFRKESKEELIQLCDKWLKMRYYLWGYKNIEPMIIFEELLEVNNNVPDDYKFFCFDGKPEFFEIHRGRFKKHVYNIYNTDFSLLPVKGMKDTFIDKVIPLPNFDKMLEIARNLSEGTDHLRVDLYNINGRIIFGELTVYPGGGWITFTPEPWDEKIGSYWH